MLSRKIPVVALVAAALGTGIVVAPGSADESTLPTTILAKGVLTGADGRPAPGAVQVTAWPLGPSSDQPQPVIASARTDASGRFTLATADLERLRPLAAADQHGRLDLEVQGVTTSGHEGRWVFSTFLRPDPTAARTRAAGTVAPVHAYSSAEGTAGTRSIRVPATGRLDGKARVSIMKAAARITPPGAPGAGGADLEPVEICPPYTWTTQSKQVVATPIGELNNAYNDTRARFAYGRTADSEISVATSSDGGGFGLSGTTKVSNSGGTLLVRKPTRRYSRRLYTNFEYEFRTKPTCGGSALREVRATKWVGGLTSKPQHNTLNVCDPKSPYKNAYAGNDEFSRDKGKATEYGGEVKVFGATLGARSGFSENVNISYSFGGSSKKKHYICGDGGRSPIDGGRIFSGPRR